MSRTQRAQREEPGMKTPGRLQDSWATLLKPPGQRWGQAEIALHLAPCRDRVARDGRGRMSPSYSRGLAEHDAGCLPGPRPCQAYQKLRNDLKSLEAADGRRGSFLGSAERVLTGAGLR